MKKHWIFTLLLVIQLGSDAKNDAKEEILHWWNRISVQTPIKCETNPEFFKEFPAVAKQYLIDRWSPLVISQPCSSTQGGHLHRCKFKGEIVNGQFEGPGKLRVVSKGNSDMHCCIARNSYNGLDVQEAVGTFKNGILEGPAKIVFNDKVSSMLKSK